MKTMKLYRQGDVLIRRLAKAPEGIGEERPRAQGRVVLARGEATGHAHTIASPRASLFEAAGRVYLAIDGEVALLEHEEHAPIEIEPGDYEVTIQREYTPSALRNVAD